MRASAEHQESHAPAGCGGQFGGRRPDSTCMHAFPPHRVRQPQQSHCRPEPPQCAATSVLPAQRAAARGMDPVWSMLGPQREPEQSLSDVWPRRHHEPPDAPSVAPLSLQSPPRIAFVNAPHRATSATSGWATCTLPPCQGSWLQLRPPRALTYLARVHQPRLYHRHARAAPPHRHRSHPSLARRRRGGPHELCTRTYRARLP